jgi:membrane protein DedA with SNARE-associated domain
MENIPPPAPPRNAWLKTRLLPALMLLFVVAIVVGVFLVSRYYPEKIESLQAYGYLGVFVISLILNATLVLPAGNILVMAVMATALPPVLGIPAPFMVGIIGGLAAAIGESTGYLAGFGGQAALEKKKNLYARMERWLKRWGCWLIMLFSALPLVFDVVGLAAGALRFPYWKFLLASWAGRTMLYTLVSWAVVLGWDNLLKFVT